MSLVLQLLTLTSDPESEPDPDPNSDLTLQTKVWTPKRIVAVVRTRLMS